MECTAWMAVAALAVGAWACAGDSSASDGGPSVGDAAPAPVWVEEPGVPTKEDLFAVWGRSLEDVYAVGWNGTIVHYDGVTWTKEVTTATVPLSDVHGRPLPANPMTPPGPIFAVGWSGTLLERAANGTWSEPPLLNTLGIPTTTLSADLFGVFVGADDNAVAVGDRGTVIGWNGTRWQLIRLRVPGSFALIEPFSVLKGIWSGDGDRYYFAGSGGATYRSSGGFASFEALDTTRSEPLRGVWGVRGGPVFTVGLDGLILRFSNGSWTRVRNEGAEDLPRAFFFDIDGLSLQDITIVGWRGTIVRYLDGRWSVEPTPTMRDLRAVWIDRLTETAFAVGASGLVLRRNPPPPDLPDAG